MTRVLGATVFALLAACTGPARGPAPGPGSASPAGPAPVGDDVRLVYVANQDAGTVSVVDGETFDVVATVPIHELVGSATAKPHHVVVEPDGSHWYVSLIGANRVLKLSRDNRVVGAAELEVPGMLALDPRSDRLYVGRSMSAVNPPQRIGVINRATMAVEEIAVVFPRPHALAAHPAHPLVYSASLARNSMAVVDPATERVEVLDVPAPDPGAGVHTVVQWAVSPDGRWLVGTGELSARLLVFSLEEPRRPELVRQIAVNPRPWHPVFTPDGAEVWFANKGSNTVTVVDTRSWAVAAVVEGEGLAEPHGAAVSADGRLVFISSNDLRGEYAGDGGTLVVIDRAGREIVAVVPVGANAAGVGAARRP